MMKWIVTTLCAVAGALACRGAGDMTKTPQCDVPLIQGVATFLPGIDIQVRDPFGRGQAIGTTATIRRDDGTSQGSIARDTLNIFSDANLTGTFTVTVSRAYYLDATIRNVAVMPNGCSMTQTKVPVTLQLAPGAPALRALIILGQEFLDGPGAQVRLVPHFDADPNVSQAVTWQMSDTTLASIDATGEVTAKCSTSGGTVKVTATAVADGTTSAFVNIGVAPASSCP